MIVGYSAYGEDLFSKVWDTPLPTSQLDELMVGAGIYDELYISVDTTISKANVRPDRWYLKNIINAKFQNDLEAGTLDANGHVITMLQVYRREHGRNDWLLIGQFDYDFDYNVYSVVDITAKNGVTYDYAFVPVSDSVVGEENVSEYPVTVKYNGVFISDLEKNYRLEIDFTQGDVTHNKNSSVMTPLNGEFPVMIFGNQDYRTGNITFLPVTEKQIQSGGTKIDKGAERELRDSVTSFLNNGQAKVLRNDNGDIMIIATNNVKSSPKSSTLMDIHGITFDYTEIGKVDSGTLGKVGLLSHGSRGSYTYDENGDVIWDI